MIEAWLGRFAFGYRGVGFAAAIMHITLVSVNRFGSVCTYLKEPLFVWVSPCVITVIIT